jgi:hypothetical protein
MGLLLLGGNLMQLVDRDSLTIAHTPDPRRLTC